MLELSCSESTSWVTELKWPEEVVGLLEIWTNGEDLVNKILNADDTVLSKAFFDQSIVGESNALLVDLSVSTLVNQLTNGLQVGVSISNVWLDNGQHLRGSSCHANKNTTVDLEETKKLENLARLWRNLVDTRNSQYAIKK
jgi:hypothetical protein